MEVWTDLESSGIQYDSISYSFPAHDGVYGIILIYRVAADSGIFHVFVNDVELGTIDSYSAADDLHYEANLLTAIEAEIDAVSIVTIKLSMDSKHNDATAYFGRLNSIMFLRTGDLP